MASVFPAVVRYPQIQALWVYRYFLLSLVKKDLNARYRKSSLGLAWSLLRPLAMSTVLCVVFSKVFNLSITEYAPYLILGITVWQFITESATIGCLSYTNAAGYLRQKPLPLALFPLRTVMSVGFHALVAFVIAVAMTILFRGMPGIAIVSLLPAMVMLFLLGWAIAVITAILHCYFPDTQHILEIGLQILFYLTPILYPKEILESRGRFMAFIEANPLTYILEMFRTPLLTGEFPSVNTMLIAGTTVSVVCLIAILFLRNLGQRIVFWV